MKPDTDLDKIICRNLQCFVNIGATEEERAAAQRILLDCELYLDLSRAARSGELSDTVCWAELDSLIQAFVSAKSWKLLETLSDDLASLVLESFPLVRCLTICAKKFCLPNAEWVGVEITRFAREAAPAQP